MSYQAVSWALYDAPQLLTDKGLIDTTARAVLVVLAEHANDTGGNAHPSPLRIHYATGYDVRTIQRALDRLEDGKLIEPQGITHTGTTRYQLAMQMRRPESEWENLRAEADETRRAESAKRKARRHRQASITQGDVRDAESRMSGTENPDIRDGESRMSGTQRHPNHQEEPPLEPPPLTTPGGAPPPDPRGHEDPSGLRTEKQNSSSESQHPHQDLISNHLPRARAREDQPGVDNPDNVTHLAQPACRDHTCHMGYVIDPTKPKGRRNIRCPTCHPNVIDLRGRKTA